jgi:hypothetical protein
VSFAGASAAAERFTKFVHGHVGCTLRRQGDVPPIMYFIHDVLRLNDKSI